MDRMRDEEGAVAIVIALLICFLIVPLAAVAVDLGVQRVARRDMQSLADMVALDLSRDVDGSRPTAAVLSAWGCAASTSGSCLAGSANRVGRSVARNTFTVGDAPVVNAQLGCADADTGSFTPVDSGCSDPNAVKVDSETSVDFSIASGRGAAHRTAIGTSKQSACFSLGSFAARFNSNDSTLLQQNGGALNDLLGANLDIVSYQGLADADVTLADLAATSTIGGVDELLGGGITLGDLLAATYQVLNAEGDPANAVALNLLNNPTAWIGSNLDTEIDLGNLLGVSTTDNAALQTDFNVLDLVAGAIGLATGENFIALDEFGLLGLTDPALSYIKVIQGRQGPACGTPNDAQAYAEASQVSVHLEGLLQNLGLGTLGLGVSAASGRYEVDAGLGGSRGQLVGPDGASYPSVYCATGAPTAVNPDKYNVRVTNGLASAGVEVAVDVVGSTTNAGSVVNVPLVSNLLNSLLGGLLGSILRVDYDLHIVLAASTSTPPPTGVAHLQVPTNSLNNDKASPPLPDGTPISLGSANALQLPGLPVTPTVTGTVTVRASRLLGLLPVTQTITFDAAMVQPLLNAVTNAVNNNAGLDAVTAGVNDALDDLGKVLGISLGGADVYAHYRAECRGADLIG